MFTNGQKLYTEFWTSLIWSLLLLSSLCPLWTFEMAKLLTKASFNWGLLSECPTVFLKRINLRSHHRRLHFFRVEYVGKTESSFNDCFFFKIYNRFLKNIISCNNKVPEIFLVLSSSIFMQNYQSFNLLDLFSVGQFCNLF